MEKLVKFGWRSKSSVEDFDVEYLLMFEIYYLRTYNTKTWTMHRIEKICLRLIEKSNLIELFDRGFYYLSCEDREKDLGR